MGSIPHGLPPRLICHKAAIHFKRIMKPRSDENRVFMQRYIVIFFLLCIFVGFASGSAQPVASPNEYPTLASLELTELPARDRIDLARRLRGVTDIPAPPDAQVHQVGEQQTFYVTNSSEGRTFPITATLRIIGEHIYLWVEEGATLSDTDLQTLADAFDQIIYPEVRGLWGSEASPGVDGDPRIYGLFAFNLGASSAAYFSSENTYPAVAVPTSNAHEMFFFNLDAFNSDSLPFIESVLSHEFQHMIRNNIHPNLELWLNEGFSEFTQVYLYGELDLSVLMFLNTPDTQLNSWNEEEAARGRNYGASLMFLLYLYDHYGMGAIHALSADPSQRGLRAVDDVLRSFGQPGVDDFFADWVMANVLVNPSAGDGRYGYHMLSSSFPAAVPEMSAAAYPFESAGSVSQYATDYFTLANLDGIHALDIHVDAPAEVGLISPSPEDGARFWYSNRSDVSDTTLTHSFDLTGVATATLNYRLWYHTERNWDYGYVMVSEDNGATWDILETSHTTTENPHDAAYGAGYNGVSGNGTVPVWIDETVSLDAYAGQSLLLHFEMITDDGVNQPGMAIDDVEIPEIDYFSDFETDDGGWEAAGWLLTDNRLPQEMWVQVAQGNSADAAVTRWRSQGNGTWRLDLAQGTEQATLAISAFAPVTTIPMPYTLSISEADAE
jgi:hypothetical protein